MSTMELPTVTVAALAAKIAQMPTEEAVNSAAETDRSVQLVDVREPHELALAKIPGFMHLPLSQAADWSANIQQYLDPTREIWVLCHHGVRSAQMTGWLIQQGFDQAKNISGGIDAYSAHIDRTIPRY
jgi:rhodanese-related sulfurtransferase